MKKWLLSVLLGTVLMSGSAMASAGAVEDKIPAELPELQRTEGQVVEIKDGFALIKGEGYYPLVKVSLTQESGRAIATVKGSNGKKASLKVGNTVRAYYSVKASRSYPPQCQGYALVKLNSEAKQGYYFLVDSVEEQGENLELLNKDHDLIVTMPKAMLKDWQLVGKDSQLLVWSDMMTMSLPARTVAVKAVYLGNLQECNCR